MSRCNLFVDAYWVETDLLTHQRKASPSEGWRLGGHDVIDEVGYLPRCDI